MTKALNPISPVVLLTLMWTITVAMASLPFLFPESFDIVYQLIAKQAGLNLDDFGWLGAAWLTIAFLIFVLASVITGYCLPQPKAFDFDINLNSAAQAAIITNAVFLLVTMLWVVVTASRVGGFNNLILMAQMDNQLLRDHLRSNTLFTGMRVFYASLPATGCMCMVIFSVGRKSGGLKKNFARLCALSFALNLVALLLLPIVMSQRLLLLQLLMSTYFAVCMINRKLVGLHYVPIAIGLFLTTWVLRESLTNPNINASALEIAFEKLVFYFVNDLLNSFIPLNYEFDHTLGVFTFKFATYFTFTDQYFAQVMSERLAVVSTLRGGGEFPIFTMPYVDFGPIGAAVYIAGLAIISRLIFHKGTENFTWAAVYGQFGGGYVLCTHTLYFSNTNFAAMIMVCLFVGSFAKRRGLNYAMST
ncbi:oligosaccharide repeat unit polymerase [Epibacterium ulvae]|uniref:oligosaccharide repeat unit polymerase n=1 Tax=Epibacterium ulvae TaxID=1156985 RepID=UPI002491B47F|nr:oligosaccharide repeat unit polymerase [Epibacterium ulvae]